MAPFTFSFGTVLPDITYCVDVVNTIALATSQLPAEKVFSQCGVEGTEFTYTLSFVLSTCDRLEFVVTPVNQAGMGSMATVSGVTFGTQWVTVGEHYQYYTYVRYNRENFKCNHYPVVTYVTTCRVDGS